MAEANGADAGATGQDGSNAGGDTSTATDDGFKPITSQDDLNAVLASRLERERGKFADYDDLKAKASRLDQIEAESKTDLQKANDRASELEADLAAIPAKTAEALRTALVSLGVVSKDDEVLLTASEPDALIAQVKRLSERAGAAKKQSNKVTREGTNSDAQPSTEREFVRDLFGSG